MKFLEMGLDPSPPPLLEALKSISSLVLLGTILCVSYIYMWVWCSYAYKYISHIHTKKSIHPCLGPKKLDIKFSFCPLRQHTVCVYMYTHGDLITLMPWTKDITSHFQRHYKSFPLVVPPGSTLCVRTRMCECGVRTHE